MEIPHRFTLSWRQALDYGIDYRDFEYRECLPIGLPLVSIAGIWNNRGSIRCLFIDASGNGYRRHIRGKKYTYIIPELEICAKEIEVGQLFINMNGIEEQTKKIREASKLLELAQKEIDQLSKE